MSDASTPSDRRPVLLAAVAAVVLVLGLAAVVLARSGPTGVQDGVRVAGVDVSGLDREALTEAVERLARERLGERVVVEGRRDEVVADREEAGLRVDVEATVEEAWSIGRGGILAPLLEGGDHDVELRTGIDGEAARRFARAASDELTTPPRPAALSLVADGDGARVEVTEPARGEVVDEEALHRRLVDELEGTGTLRLDAAADDVEPAVVEADMEAVRPEAERAVSAPVVLRNPAGGADLPLAPPQLASVLEVALDESAPEGERFEVRSSPALLGTVVDDELAEAITVAPTDARFVTEGDAVSIEGGDPGFAFDAEAVASQVAEVATRAEGPRDEEMAGPRPQPDVPRTELEALDIQEQVSTFTTEHACCEPRVDNIQLMADMVDGTVIRPGERFSLNDHVGPRTREKGFQEDGVIVDGELVDAVGGGVSQFATTFFNAAFFSGIELVEFQPHSFYISRYPEGREATLAYGSIDVAVVNDSPHGILVTTSYTPTSITVSFWSRPWAEVEARSSGRRNVVPGARSDGFDVTTERQVTYPDGRTEVESWEWTYERRD
jgi:vancomycin resistance protein YoaR